MHILLSTYNLYISQCIVKLLQLFHATADMHSGKNEWVLMIISLSLFKFLGISLHNIEPIVVAIHTVTSVVISWQSLLMWLHNLICSLTQYNILQLCAFETSQLDISYPKGAVALLVGTTLFSVSARYACNFTLIYHLYALHAHGVYESHLGHQKVNRDRLYNMTFMKSYIAGFEMWSVHEFLPCMHGINSSEPHYTV